VRRTLPLLAALLTLVFSGCGSGALQGLPACDEAGPRLTALPLAEEDYQVVRPLGSLGPTSHTLPTEHHYFYLTPSQDPETGRRAPARAMAAGWVVEVASLKHAVAGFTDYDLTLGLCRDFSISYGHLSELTDDLLAELAGSGDCETYTTDGETYTRCRYRLRHQVDAGELLGYAGGNPDQYALDIGAHDYRREQNVFVNQQRYRSDASYMIYAVSALDYLTPELQTLVDAKVGGWNGAVRTVPPVHGQISYDVPGTAMGNWFREGAPTHPEDPHLALVRDNVDPGVYAISAGTSLGGLAGYVVLFDPQAGGVVDRAFDEISDGRIYCYPSQRSGSGAPAGRVLLQLDGADRLQAEFQAGLACTGELAFSEPVSYVR